MDHPFHICVLFLEKVKKSKEVSEEMRPNEHGHKGKGLNSKHERWFPFFFLRLNCESPNISPVECGNSCIFESGSTLFEQLMTAHITCQSIKRSLRSTKFGEFKALNKAKKTVPKGRRKYFINLFVDMDSSAIWRMLRRSRYIKGNDFPFRFGVAKERCEWFSHDVAASFGSIDGIQQCQSPGTYYEASWAVWFLKTSDWNVLQQIINESLRQLLVWSMDNSLLINPTKSKAMLFGNANRFGSPLGIYSVYPILKLLTYISACILKRKKKQRYRNGALVETISYR
uniref:Uncharacterized protein n=1 Tax=Glossina pallidipes TaxID=7398 RepID=A0A1B0AAG1_GLOPL